MSFYVSFYVILVILVIIVIIVTKVIMAFKCSKLLLRTGVSSKSGWWIVIGHYGYKSSFGAKRFDEKIIKEINFLTMNGMWLKHISLSCGGEILDLSG